MTDSQLNDRAASWLRYRVIFDLFVHDVSTLSQLQVPQSIRGPRPKRRSSRGVSTALRSYSGGLWWEQLPMPWLTT